MIESLGQRPANELPDWLLEFPLSFLATFNAAIQALNRLVPLGCPFLTLAVEDGSPLTVANARAVFRRDAHEEARRDLGLLIPPTGIREAGLFTGAVAEAHFVAAATEARQQARIKGTVPVALIDPPAAVLGVVVNIRLLVPAPARIVEHPRFVTTKQPRAAVLAVGVLKPLCEILPGQ